MSPGESVFNHQLLSAPSKPKENDTLLSLNERLRVAKGNNLEKAQQLISAKADVNLVLNKESNETILHEAIENAGVYNNENYTNFALFLIDAKAHVNARFSEGDYTNLTPLYKAVDWNMHQLILPLLKANADITIEAFGEKLLSPFQLALRKLSPSHGRVDECAIKLVEYGLETEELSSAIQEYEVLRTARNKYENQLTPFLHATLTDTGYLIQALTTTVLEYCYSATRDVAQKKQ